jgi:serine/threonine protein kinase
VPKICDFGLARILAKNQLTNSYCGTKSYFSPEILNRSKYNYKVDIWALGVILFKILFKSYPFGSNNGAESLEKIKKRLDPVYRLSE